MIVRTKNEDAVSPVIGTILMVAITVILAAVIASFTFGMVSAVPHMRIVSISAHRTSDTTATVMSMGGPGIEGLTELRIFVDEGFQSLLNPAAGSETTVTVRGHSHIVVVGRYSGSDEQVVFDKWL